MSEPATESAPSEHGGTEDTGVAPDSGAERVPLPPARPGEDDSLRAFRVPSIITDRILLGSYAHSLNQKALQHMGVTHILNVNTSHRFRDTPCVVKHVPMSDYGDADLANGPELRQCFEFMDLACTPTASGAPETAPPATTRILVHCSKGVNRSPTVVIAYLVKRLGWSLRKAYRHVTAVRHLACPHERYFVQLQALEVAWHGLDAPTLSREEAGPSLQQIMREMQAAHAPPATSTGTGAGAGAGAGASAAATACVGAGAGGDLDAAAGAGTMAGDGKAPLVVGDDAELHAAAIAVADAAGTQAPAHVGVDSASMAGQLPSPADFAAALMRGASSQ